MPVEDPELMSACTRAGRALQSLLETLGRTPINLEDITEQLSITREMVETANNSLELRIQQVKLAEKLLVYGNRYVEKEGMYVVDLTIAEDQFRQGNYQTVVETMKAILGNVEGSRFDVSFYQFKQDLGCHLI